MASFQGEWSRRASHANSWYHGQGEILDKELRSWIEKAENDSPDESSSKGKCRCVAVIAPHAGYSYSGPTAAFAYQYLKPAKIKRVFIIGPSHHHYLETCALSAAKSYETPIGNLEIDREMNKHLRETGFDFQTMSRSVDEDEHSIEMHLPFVAHVMKTQEYKIVPILVGNISARTEKVVGQLLEPYFADEANFFVFSSDFCHWGSRFRYQHYNKEHGEIFRSIEKLDRRGMELIEAKDVRGFGSYLQETRNTICGRHPIGVLLNAVEQSPISSSFNIEFVKYAQSSRVHRMSDSSVSYASGVVTVVDKEML